MRFAKSLRVAFVLSFGAYFAACSSSAPIPDETMPVTEPAPQATDDAATDENLDDDDNDEDPVESLDPIVRSHSEATHRTSPTGEVSITWLAEGRNAYVGTISLAPETVVPEHRHESEEYLFIQEGGGIMTIEGREYELSAGSMVAVPSNAEHRFVNGPETTVAFQVFAKPGAQNRFLEWPESQPPQLTGSEDAPAAETED